MRRLLLAMMAHTVFIAATLYAVLQRIKKRKGNAPSF